MYNVFRWHEKNVKLVLMVTFLKLCVRKRKRHKLPVKRYTNSEDITYSTVTIINNTALYI